MYDGHLCKNLIKTMKEGHRAQELKTRQKQSWEYKDELERGKFEIFNKSFLGLHYMETNNNLMSPAWEIKK